MASNTPRNNPLPQTKIALWGPTGAGKDWLFRSFAKELDYYNRIDQDFHYEMGELQPGETFPMPVSPEPPINIPPTTSINDIHYIFRRVPMRQDPAHLISAGEGQDIVIHNDKGANLVESLNDSVTFEPTFQMLISAQNIFLVLGIPVDNAQSNPPPKPEPIPTFEMDDFGRQVEERNRGVGGGNNSRLYSPGAESANWSCRDYLRFMRLLFATLERTPGRNLAVCMTKSDQSEFRSDPWSIFQLRYRSEMRRLLEVNRQRHNIEVFVTSAAGYLKQGGEVMPNYQDGAIRDTNRWNPVNTAAPFFWIFEKIERALLPKKTIFGPDPQRMYIAYPKPRSF